jgi:hypothetical protein
VSAVPPPSRRRRLWRVLLVAGLIVSAVISAFVLYAYYRHATEDDRVRRAADRLTAPSGWKQIAEVKEPGDPFLCIVTCFHPQVIKVFLTNESRRAACDTMRAQVDQQVSTTRGDVASDCRWRAQLHSVGRYANVFAYAETAEELLRTPERSWVGVTRPVADGTYVYVIFSGGGP